MVESKDQVLCALSNSEVGWLMHLRETHDPGFSSRNPAYAGPEQELINYVRSTSSFTNILPHWLIRVATVAGLRAFPDERYSADIHRKSGSPWTRGRRCGNTSNRFCLGYFLRLEISMSAPIPLANHLYNVLMRQLELVHY